MRISRRIILVVLLVGVIATWLVLLVIERLTEPGEEAGAAVISRIQVSVHRQRIEAVVAPLLQEVRRQWVMLGERLWRNMITMAVRRNLERERCWRGVIRQQPASGLGISEFFENSSPMVLRNRRGCA